MIDITIIPILQDNYTYLLRADNGQAAIVDPGEAYPVIDMLERLGIGLDYILNTHHHDDHIAGNAELVEKYGAKLAGPAAEQARIPDMDILLREGDIFTFGNEDIQILETPGHTSGHICFYLPLSRAVFTGDTLFSMSCGRLFEGTAEQMWNSLQKIVALPGETRVYCGHEYTLSNGLFCLTIEPKNHDLQKRVEDVRALRTKNLPSLPSTIALEIKTNVFLRAGSAERFAEIRERKNNS